MKFTLKILILGLVLLGCTDDNNPFDHSSKPKFLLLKKTTQETENYTRTTEYVYSDNKLVTVNYERFNKSSNSNYYTKTEYEYINENEYYRFYYLNNELETKRRYFKPTPNTIRREQLDPLSGELLNYNLVEIGNSCGATKYYSYDNNNILTYRIEFFFYDSNCSSNRLSYDGDGNFKDKYQYVRDNKKSPYMTLYMSNFNKINPENWHNIIEYNHWDENNILRSSHKSNFEYNEDGYPTFEEDIYQYNDDTPRVTTVYYEYY